MPIPGTGIIPSGAEFSQLQSVTRRAIIPQLVVQIYEASPTLSALMGNAQRASGGISSVTVPVQGQAMTTTQTTNYGGTFNVPGDQTGIQNGEFNLKGLITPLALLGMEPAVQMGEKVLSLLEARANDAGQNMIQFMSNAISSNYTDNSNLIGFAGAIDDGTNMNTYGGINRTSNTWWKGNRYAAGSVAPQRANVMTYEMGTVKASGELPSFGVMGPGTWMKLAEDYLGFERYTMKPDGVGYSNTASGPKAGFTALMVGNVPIFADPYFPEGTLYLVNTRYLALYIHDKASFYVTPFSNLQPIGQLGYLANILTLAEMVCAKPKAQTVVTGYTYETI